MTENTCGIEDTPVTEKQKMFHAIFTTALEGGIGYWSIATAYHWSDDAGCEDWRGFFANIEDDVDGGEYRIDANTISRGYRLALQKRDEIAWSDGKPPFVVRDYLDDWDFDSMDADCIVQLGIFGEVRYG